MDTNTERIRVTKKLRDILKKEADKQKIATGYFIERLYQFYKENK